MIEARHSILIQAGIGEVWNYVRDMQRWAPLFPGCRGCEVRTRDESEWTIKVGAGGLVKTVIVQVQVQRWAEPGAVDFSYVLKSEPVKGKGRYEASSKGSSATEITMQLQVEGSGQMAPMWEAISKPLLPELARSFAESLRAEIEGIPKPTLGSRMLAWLQSIWRSLFAVKKSQASEQEPLP